MKRMFHAICLSLMLIFSVSSVAVTSQACAPKTYHTAVATDNGIAQSLFTLQRTEQATYNAHVYNQVSHQKYAATILRALQAGNSLNEALATWTPGDAPPAIVASALQSLNIMLVELRDVLPKNNALINALVTTLALLVPKG
jgi:hypothetical protein